MFEWNQRLLKKRTGLRLGLCLLGLGLVSPATAETFTNRWTQVQLGAERGAAMAVAGGPWADWAIEPVGNGHVRLKHAASGQYLHVEQGLAVGTIDPGWWSAQWTLEPAGEYVRIRNRWTDGALHVEQGPLVVTPVDPGWWSAQWQVGVTTAMAAPAKPQPPAVIATPPFVPTPARPVLVAPAAAPAATAPTPAWVGKTWAAMSSAGEAITGNVTVSRSEIVFGNGARLPLKVLDESLSGQWGFSGETGKAVLFEITDTANPPLLSGNRLCGMKQHGRYLTLWVAPNGGMYLSSFKGPALPASPGFREDQTCSILYFGPAD